MGGGQGRNNDVANGDIGKLQVSTKHLGDDLLVLRRSGHLKGHGAVATKTDGGAVSFRTREREHARAHAAILHDTAADRSAELRSVLSSVSYVTAKDLHFSGEARAASRRSAARAHRQRRSADGPAGRQKVRKVPKAQAQASARRQGRKGRKGL